MVVALPQAIEEGLGETKTKTVIGILLEVHLVQGTRGIAHLEVQLLIDTEVAVVDEIARTNAVDAEQLITRLKAQLLADRTRLNLIHHGRLRLAGNGTGFQGRHRDAGGGLIPHRGRAFPSVCGVKRPPDQQPQTKQKAIGHKDPGAVPLQEFEQPIDGQPGHHRR